AWKKSLKRDTARPRPWAKSCGGFLQARRSRGHQLAHPSARGKGAQRNPWAAGSWGLAVLCAGPGPRGVVSRGPRRWRHTGLAASETKRAKSQTELAEASLKKAVKARADEKTQRELADQRLYDAQMTLAQRNWEDGDVELLQRGRDEQLPANQGGTDRRGF